jgi:surface antigen
VPEGVCVPRVSRTLRHACALALGGLVLSLLPQVAPAQAITSGYICTGYSACKDAGYPNAGYAANNDKMYWRMYSGHNCTNYVAYRMVRAGMPNVRPWTGGGNATHWGHEMSEITDQQPRVGAVAWWKANVPGAGSAGHVAYVEKVISPTEIVISEDSWGGDFHWRKLSKGPGWPSGFIHFVDKQIDNLTPPTVTGTPQVGVPLTATPGTWKPDANVRFQWLVDGTAIPGATNATYTPVAELVGHTVAVKVVATHKKFAPTSITVPTSGPVAKGVFSAVETPVVSGDPIVNQTLTATPGAWSPTPSESEIRWRADNEPIEGASGPQLTLTRELVGKEITAVSKARREGYTRAATLSAPVGPVLLGRIEVVEPFRAAGRNRVGSRMWVEPGTFTPNDATVSYTWFRDGVQIAGATASDYAVVPADAGARMTAKVTLTKAEYATRVLTFKLGGPVTTKPQLEIRTVGKPGSAVVVVDVVSAGVNNPGGTVTIRIGNKSETVRPSGGRVRVRINDLQAGKHRVRVSYTGTQIVEPARESAYVRVLR